jgi:hypothetical protein
MRAALQQADELSGSPVDSAGGFAAEKVAAENLRQYRLG